MPPNSVSSIRSAEGVQSGRRGNHGCFDLAPFLHFTVLSYCPHCTLSTLSITQHTHWDICSVLVSSVANSKNTTQTLITESFWGCTTQADAIHLFCFSFLSFQHATLASASCRKGGGGLEKAVVVAALGYLSVESFHWRYCVISP